MCAKIRLLPSILGSIGSDLSTVNLWCRLFRPTHIYSVWQSLIMNNNSSKLPKSPLSSTFYFSTISVLLRNHLIKNVKYEIIVSCVPIQTSQLFKVLFFVKRNIITTNHLYLSEKCLAVKYLVGIWPKVEMKPSFWHFSWNC